MAAITNKICDKRTLFAFPMVGLVEEFGVSWGSADGSLWFPCMPIRNVMQEHIIKYKSLPICFSDGSIHMPTLQFELHIVDAQEFYIDLVCDNLFFIGVISYTLETNKWQFYYHTTPNTDRTCFSGQFGEVYTEIPLFSRLVDRNRALKAIQRLTGIFSDTDYDDCY